MGSRQNHARPHLGGLAHFSYEYIMFLKEFLEEGEISPRWAHLTGSAHPHMNSPESLEAIKPLCIKK